MCLRRVLIGAMLFILQAASAVAEQVTLFPTKDNTLYEDVSGSLSNGAGAGLFVGDNRLGSHRRAVLAFDLTSIPQGSTIVSAALTLSVEQTQDGSQRAISVHRLLQDWGEAGSVAGGAGGGGGAAQAGDATWIHTFFNNQFWNSAGGSFQGASASRQVGAGGPYTWGSTSGLVADVQNWVDDPAGNFGWILIGAEGVNQTARRFSSREGSDSPFLTVEFTPPLELTERISFAHFGNGDGFFSQITLVNTNDTVAANARIVINDNDGNPFPVMLNGESSPNGEWDAVVPPSGIRVYKTDATGQPEGGSVIVYSDHPLTGVIVFGGAFGLAGVGAGEDTSVGFTGPVEVSENPNVNTGLAVQNLEDSQITVDLELLDADGNVVANAQLLLPAWGNLAGFVPDIDWVFLEPVDFSAFLGTVRATTTDDVSATMIQQRVDGSLVQFATLPVETR